MKTRVVVYSTNELPSATNYVVRPALQKTNVIYQFACHCDIGWYVGLLSQRLQDRIKQHISKSICSSSSSQKRLLPACRCKSSTRTNTQSFAFDSDIGFHLVQNPVCTQHYDESRFSILVQGRSTYPLLFPFLSKTAPLSIYLLFFPFIYFHPYFQPRPLPTKRICVQLRDCLLMTLSDCFFSSQLRLGFFL